MLRRCSLTGTESHTSPGTPPAAVHDEWLRQWSLFDDDAEFLLWEWIAPTTPEHFQGKTVLEAGCGQGQHTRRIAGMADAITAVDLNTAALARRRNAQLQNVEFRQADISTMDLGRDFDIVMCVGVIHHTDDPDQAFSNLYRHCKPGGRLIIWTYSAEGNELVRYLVEPVRKVLLRHLPRRILVWVARAVTGLLYAPVHTLYRVPQLRLLPYFDYFANFRRLDFRRNVLNVFDKLNAPQTHFTTLSKAREWFCEARFEKGSIHIRPYAGVSYSLNGIKRTD